MNYERGKQHRMTWEAKYTIDERTGCHVWCRACQSRGYGVVWFDGKLHLAHRVAWFRKHGAWPTEGLVLDHICENKPCVNADHLRELPNHLNLRRAYRRGDVETEARRARWRKATAKRRGNYRYAEGGG